MGKSAKSINGPSALNYMKDLKQFIALTKDSDPQLKRAGQAAVELAKRFQKMDANLNGKLDGNELPKAYKWNPMVSRYNKLMQHLSLLLSERNNRLFRFAKENLVKTVSKLARNVIPKVAATSSTWRSLEQLGLWMDVGHKTVVMRLKRQSGPFLRKVKDEDDVIGDPEDVINFGYAMKVVDVKKSITGISVTKKGHSFTFVVTTTDGTKHVKSFTLKEWSRETEVITTGGSKETQGLLILGVL
jgi:predicted transcriptional regulator